ncbi:MAG TPA: DUF481 domain-containing protein [Bacteroidetes bacterium]|nr:DUF481 domain-containing protein [Bacteroidota bacterium]
MKRYFTIFLLLAVSYVSLAQDIKGAGVKEENTKNTSLRHEALNIFLDCRWCDRNYIKQTIPFVNYVNNKDEADVHILVRRRVTGGGGGEYIIDFIGQGEFLDIQEEMIFFSPIDQTADETRKARANVLAMGLMKYVARTPMSKNIRISYEDDGTGSDGNRGIQSSFQDDPWKSWIFRLSGSGEFQKDENYETSRASSSLSADRVTPDLKMEFDLRYSNRQTYYTSTRSKSYRENWSIQSLLVKSLGYKWSAGGRVSIESDTYNNYKLATNVGPAIEYNLFPYEESFKRQFRIQYGLNAKYNNYNDTTTYFKTSEFLLSHYLSTSLGFNQPWGSGWASMTWSNYLHDFSENNLGLRASIYYRIYKGLSVNVQSRANLIHDQRNLVKGDATEQEVLTRQRVLKTSYSYSFELGLTYSFGSIYNNVVNPRFGN